MKYKDKNIFITKYGYPIITNGTKQKLVHVLEWESHNGPKPEGMHIHHIDRDKSNWNIDNLQLLTRSDHFRLHAGWIMENGEWIKKPCNKCKRILPLDKFWTKLKTTRCSYCIECSLKGTKRSLAPNENGEYECFTCKQWKSKESFIFKKNGKPQSYCRECRNKYKKEYRKKRSIMETPLLLRM